jgi:hypothetical protein
MTMKPSQKVQLCFLILAGSKGAECCLPFGRDEQEFQDYLQAPRISAANDPLEWWKANQTRFPTLFPMAKSFLGCPATTAELERVFSKAGKLHDDQHESVLDVTLEQQLFAAFNWKC